LVRPSLGGRAVYGGPDVLHPRYGLEASSSLFTRQERSRRQCHQRSVRTAKRPNLLQDTAAERWSRLYVDIRASYGRAAIQAALFLNGGAAVALLALVGNLAIAHQSKGLTGSFRGFKHALVFFGIGVMLAASSSVVAFLIQVAAIAHPEQAEGRNGRRFRAIGIGMVVASLVVFAAGITLAANAIGSLMGALE
jgi:hypothetical protein